MSTFINPFTDFGFKKLFGEEASKPLLKAFLNDLLPLRDKIVELEFSPTAQLPPAQYERKAIYDIFCTDEKGHRFIVELQKNRQNYFRDRTVYYSTFPIQKQAKTGHWDFKLAPVYCIGLLNFVFDDEPISADYRHTIKLKNQHCQVFYDKLTFMYIEFPKFDKSEDALENHFEKFIYFIKHLEDFDHIPAIFKGDIIEQGFERARLAQMDERQREAYEQSLKELRDAYNVVQSAREEGEAIGAKRERVKTEQARQRAQRAEQKQQYAEQKQQHAEQEREQAKRERALAEQEREQAKREREQAEQKHNQEQRVMIENLLERMTLEQAADIIGLTLDEIDRLLSNE